MPCHHHHHHHHHHHFLALAGGGKDEGSKSGQASLGGKSLLDCVIYARVAGAACAKYVWGDSVKVTSLAALAGGGLVKPDDPDAKIKFLAAEALCGVGGLVFDALGIFANELGRRDYVTGEMWKTKPPFRLALNMAASDEIAWHCKHYTAHKIMKFYESGAALAHDMGVPVAKMEESIEASLKTAENPDGGPYPRLPER